jgi:hypothetical protein
VYTVKKEDKDEKHFQENVDKLRGKITEHDKELKHVFDPEKEGKYKEQFEYNNKLKYKIKFDPANFDEMKSDVTEFYKKEQEEQEKNKKRTDDIIESMVGLNLIDNDTQIGATNNHENDKEMNTTVDTENKCSEASTYKEISRTISTDKYLQRQKKV